MPLDFSEKAALPVKTGSQVRRPAVFFKVHTALVRRVQPFISTEYRSAVQPRSVRFSVPVYAALFPKNGKSFFIFEREKMNGEKKEWAVERLKEKSRETGRLPKKEDFDPVTLSRIKAFLGPWPRALEAAGLKERKTAARGGKERK